MIYLKLFLPPFVGLFYVRFGTGSPAQGSDALKKAEEQKRKARAERFVYYLFGLLPAG